MGADSTQHLVQRTQRRFLTTVVVIAVIVAAIAVPLVVDGSLRLDLAKRAGLAPGEGVEQVASGKSGDLLIVIPVTAELGSQRTETRFHAAYLTSPAADGTRFTNLDTGHTFTVPLTDIGFIAADPTGDHLLLNQRSGLQTEHYLLTVGSDTAEPLPPNQEMPTLPGNWRKSIWETRIGECEGISPKQTWVACFPSPSFNRFLAGDWQLDILRYGAAKERHEIFRGTGTRPLVGFAANDTMLYFQNEEGIWRVSLQRYMG